VITLGAFSDDNEAGLESPGPAVPTRVGSACVGKQERHAIAERDSKADAREQRGHDFVDDVAGAHRDATGGDGLASNELRRVGEEPLEHGGAEARPDEPCGDVLIGRVELVQVCVRRGRGRTACEASSQKPLYVA